MNPEKLKEELNEVIKIPELWFSHDNEKFWMKDGRGIFIQYSKSVISSRLEHEFEISPKDAKALFAKSYKDNVVDLITPIGGFKLGIHKIAGNRVLVPKEQRRIKPLKGDWATLESYMKGMLGKEQFEWYKGWLQTWLIGFYSYKFVPGQVLICIGETGCGKTLLKHIHNHIFDGGGQPLKYMTGGTGFNGELCGVCSLHIDDKLNDLGANGKRKLKAECKELAVAGEWRFEFKHKTAFSASPVQRLSIFCNYTEDSVSVMPDIDESTRDKISILDCKRKEMPMPTRTQADKDAFWKQIESELPAYLYHIMEEHVITEEFADTKEERMGVRGYHNEQALRFVDAYSNDGKRLHALIEVLRRDNEREWTGSAGDLIKLLHKEGAEKYANAMSMGRFLNQRMECGTKLIKSLGQRKYWIDLQDYEDAEEDSLNLVEETVQVEEVPELNDRQVDLLEEEEDDYF
jgi:hypothetical protein